MLIAVPILAAVITGAFFYSSYAGQSYAVNFKTMLLIDVQLKNLSGSVRIYPNGTIGEPGGIMNTTKYLKEGLNGRYPLYTVDRTGQIYVQSSVSRDYTLGDFFQVWGEPLGINNTLGLPYYDPPHTCGMYHNATCAPYYWTMCLHDPTTKTDIPNADWGSHVLVNQEIIRISYSQIGCA